ncbi:hypothetical protein [Promicromonospora sukumoe]|uniref:hypothetical protein n=1 Tax=Promicromonospora sukumoe TaxID=88382 RepID=UPI0003685543|nr:hypothetical protein [Promicromonospora sukumoe]
MFLERSMPTSDLRRFLPSARRACASLVASVLVLGLTMTTAGATPVQATPPGRMGTVVQAANETLDRTFVQEGMPSARGGQLVSWGDQSGGSTTQALPDGVHATAVSTDHDRVLVLRTDGRVDLHQYDTSPYSLEPLPAPSNGTRYMAVSAVSGRILRSDGVVVSLQGRPEITPPDGLAYTAISGELALRSDGVLSNPGNPDGSCADVRDPGAGPHYTAVSARTGLENWAALRSDGALVYCQDAFAESTAAVVDPPAGTRFVGVDMGVDEAIGATADGRVISTNGRQLAAAPTGRSIVSLAAMSNGQGAAALDDGTIISWGLNGQDAAPPVIPAGRDVFSAVSGYSSSGQHWAIVVGDPIPVEVSVDVSVSTDSSGPMERPTRVTDIVALKVSATLDGGAPVPGRVTTTVIAPDGKTHTLEPEQTYRGTAEVELYPWDHEQVGTYVLSTAFSGSPYTVSPVETTVDLAEPSPVVVTTTGPDTWYENSTRTLCFELSTTDGSPLWLRSTEQIRITVDGRPDLIQFGEFHRECVDRLDLDPGTYTLHYDYEGWSEVDSVAWSKQVVVLPPVATRIESDLPSSWHYGEMPASVEVDVFSDSSVPAGITTLELDRLTIGYGSRLDGGGHSQIRITDEDELAPGTYAMVVRFRADDNFRDASLERTVTVRPASFTTTPPTITGTPQIGSTLTAVPGTWSPAPTSTGYVWKVDGVAVAGATSSTFTVPASAAGKRITVTVTGDRQYYNTGSATSAPTATVAPTTFTAAPIPAVKGTAQVGKTLTVTRGTWSPAPSSVKYVWKANGTTISTQTSSSFVVPTSAKGKRLTVTVTGSRTGYTTRSVTSPATRTVAAGTFSARRPAIKGTTRVGSTLTVVRGTWTPAPSALKYVWKANGVTIATRTSSTFVVPARARGKQLTVTVTGARAGYTSKSVASYRTATIR